MSIYCIQCGTPLPGDAVFCLKCGKQQKPSTQQAEAKWEVCEIKMIARTFTYQLCAEAVGPGGMYTASVSKGFPLSGYMGESKSRDKLLKALVDQLVQEGWEPQGLGANWYSHKFRRKVN